MNVGQAMSPSPYRWVIVSTLCVTETISWGVLYYAFGILLTPMEQAMGWSRAETSGAFSLAVLVSAIAAVPAGRWVDRGGARPLMTLGSIAATALMVAWARVESLPALYLVWAGAGVAMAAVLAEPAFAVLTRWFGHDRERAFTILALAAGLASTIFSPVASWLVTALGWREAVLVLAALLGMVTIPMHALLLRGGPREAPAPGPSRRAVAAGAADPAPRAVLRTATFWLLALAFLIQAFAHAGISLHAIAMLIEWGYAPSVAALVMGVVGAMMIVGRLLLVPLRARLSVRGVTVCIFVAQAVSFLALWAAPGPAGLSVFVAGFGISAGMAALVRASIVADLWGRAYYGVIAGALSVSSTVARAIAPLSIGLAYLACGGYRTILLVLALLSVVAVLSAARAFGVRASGAVSVDHARA